MFLNKMLFSLFVLGSLLQCVLPAQGLRTLDKVRLSTLACKANCLETYTPSRMQGEFNCFRHPQCWTCWFGCKLFHQNIKAWSIMCGPKSHEICLEGCETSCRFHQSDNELYDAHPMGPLETQEVVGDVKYQYDLEENMTNIEWDYRPDAQISGVILVVGTNVSLNDTTPVNPQNLYIIGRTFYRNITIDDTYLDGFCTIRLATVNSEKKISLLNVHTEHLKRHTNRCHSTGVHHHPPIISSVHVTDLRKRYNISDKEAFPNSHGSYSNNNHNDNYNQPVHNKPSVPSSTPASFSIPGQSVSPATSDRHFNNIHSNTSNTTDFLTSSATSAESKGASSSIEKASLENNVSFYGTPSRKMHRLVSSFTSHLELFPAPVLISLAPPTTLDHSSTGSTKTNSSRNGDVTTVSTSISNSAVELLKAVIRWEPFMNSSEDGSCTSYKITWKIAVIDKVAGDLLTCSTNASITVERNSVYHVWVSLFGHEQIRTKQLTVETALAQFAKLRAVDVCHGCVRGDYTTGVSAALASLIVLAVAVFLLIKSYRSYTLRDHKLRNSGSSFLMPSALLGESGAKPTMHVIEPKMLNSAASSSRASAHVTITPIAAHGPEGQAPSSLRSSGPYEPLGLGEEDANYFVFDLPKNYIAV